MVIWKVVREDHTSGDDDCGEGVVLVIHLWWW